MTIPRESEFESLGNLLPPCCGDDADFRRCLRRIPSSKWCGSRLRRWVDISMAATVLVVFAVPMLIIACFIRVSSRGPSFIRQERVGRGGRLFEAIKFRTMYEGADAGLGLTTGGDARVTPLGAFLRKLKLDELPQFWNVLRGDMSLVGPRPKLPQFEGIPSMPYRPGITGLASLVFCDEAQVLRRLPPDRVETFYMLRIRPLKAKLDVCYMCQATPRSDARMIAATAVSCLVPGIVLRWLRRTRGALPFHTIPVRRDDRIVYIQSIQRAEACSDLQE